ncbi:aldolase/citrate lyase family protein [Roseomonas sp. OT10]|uniref:HpcH/HpaI aldolase family protein n=1 Tax=Roseomonas cutis TaxID=2897332 RepID=UPI001E50E8AD|nr:aldolase/citrate lyase family protein [Roseomonas sp. OT10]UFN48270.1 aldolase/citrate lyase family protein [Roseomonas sp. OT10]
MLMRKPNKVRQKLAAGRVVTGTAIYSGAPSMVEAAGYSGIDFVRIDTEHAWRRDESLENMLRAAAIAEVVPIVRIDRDDPYLARKALEVGAGGVLVPHVTSAADAREVVAAAKFPPLGRRGIGSLCISGEWGRRTREEWVAWSNAEPLVGVMIESAGAIPVVREILAVEGIDFALFGPSDFGMSLGSDDEAMVQARTEEALTRTCEAARATGKHVMFGVGMQDEAIEARIAQGVTMLELSHDVVILRNTLARKVADFGDRPSGR